MCLAIAGEVISLEGSDPALGIASVDFWGYPKTVDIALTPDVVLVSMCPFMLGVQSR